jgi:hypothetical protein
LLFGYEASLPIDSALRLPDAMKTEFSRDLLDRARTARDVAALTQQLQQVQSKIRFDAGRKDITFKPGDKVYLKIMARKKGVSPKLSYAYAGPYLILRQTAPNDYQILNPSNRQTQVVTVRRLKPFFDQSRIEHVEPLPPKKVTFQVAPTAIASTEEEIDEIELDSEDDKFLSDVVVPIVGPSGMQLRPRRKGRVVSP